MHRRKRLDTMERLMNALHAQSGLGVPIVPTHTNPLFRSVLDYRFLMNDVRTVLSRLGTVDLPRKESPS